VALENVSQVVNCLDIFLYGFRINKVISSALYGKVAIYLTFVLKVSEVKKN